MGLRDDILTDVALQEGKAKSKRGPKDEIRLVDGTKPMLIQQQLNKLFYVSPNFNEEIEMLKAQAELKSNDRYGLHASAILAPESEFCYREQVLSLFYKQIQGENIPIGLKRIFEEGNFIGEKWQRLFIRGGIGKKEDMDISRFAKQYDLSYTPDAIITLFGRQILVEVKSQNTFLFKKEKHHAKGIKQLKFYMFLSGIHIGFVLVEDKNDQNFKVQMPVYDPAEMEPYIERLEMIQIYKRKFIDEREMVDRHEGCTSSTCKMAKKCNMRDACWNIGMGRVKLENRPTV